jgi:Flp pilus assembly protein CpaB
MQLAIPGFIPSLIPRHRAVLGGLLIALAAALAFLAASAGDSTPTRAVVIARRDITPGAQITAADLERRSVPVSDDLASHGFSTTDELVRATALAPVGAGELVQRSAIRTETSPTSGSGFSFAIDREHALDGNLRPGDSVDVLATFGSGLDAETAVLASTVRIAQITTTDATSVAGAGRLVITAEFSDGEQLLDVAHAAQVAALTLVRSNGSAPIASGRRFVTSPIGRTDVGDNSGIPWGLP